MSRRLYSSIREDFDLTNCRGTREAIVDIRDCLLRYPDDQVCGQVKHDFHAAKCHDCQVTFDQGKESSRCKECPPDTGDMSLREIWYQIPRLEVRCRADMIDHNGHIKMEDVWQYLCHDCACAELLLTQLRQKYGIPYIPHYL